MRNLLAAMLLLVPLAAAGAELPIFDAHLHYSHDAWDVLPPKDVVAILTKAGVRRALVSSSGDDGQQRLKAEAPDLIVTELRPYRSRGDVGTWFRDETVPAYLEERLKKFRYAGLGEFHLYGANADLPVPRRMVQLARQHKLFLHAHSDADAVERLFKQWPERGFCGRTRASTGRRTRDMLRKHRNLWCDPHSASIMAWRQGGSRMVQGVPRVPRPLHGRYRHVHAGGYTTWSSTRAGRAVAGRPAARGGRAHAYRNGEALFPAQR
jgi:hypothetical protein